MQAELTEIAKDAIQRGFEVTPDSIYGLLIGFLAIALTTVFWLREQDKKTIIKLKLATLESLKDMNQSIVLLQQSHTQDSSQILEELAKVNQRIEQRFEAVQKIT